MPEKIFVSNKLENSQSLMKLIGYITWRSLLNHCRQSELIAVYETDDGGLLFYELK